MRGIKDERPLIKKKKSKNDEETHQMDLGPNKSRILQGNTNSIDYNPQCQVKIEELEHQSMHIQSIKTYSANTSVWPNKLNAYSD